MYLRKEGGRLDEIKQEKVWIKMIYTYKKGAKNKPW